MNQTLNVKLVANCIPVRGLKRSVICDLQRKNIDLIPNDLYDIITQQEGKTISEIKKKYLNEYDDIIDEYFEFLINKEYIFFTETPNLFPKMRMNWFMPTEISNAIIDVGVDSHFDLFNILEGLNNLNCKYVEFRFFKDVDIEIIYSILIFINKMESTIVSIDLNLLFIDKFQEDFISEFMANFPRLSSVRLFSAPYEKFIKLDNTNNSYIIYSKKIIKNETFCGVIDSSLFAINIQNFTESRKHNSCLNKKISIDVDGNIKNCPSMKESYGNISDTTLKEAINKKDFKKYWNITKDQINVCKDCEFRYICTDCRAYTEDPENKYSKPLKCGYDPNTNVWEEWSSNPLKQKAIEHYGMQDLVKWDD